MKFINTLPTIVLLHLRNQEGKSWHGVDDGDGIDDDGHTTGHDEPGSCVEEHAIARVQSVFNLSEYYGSLLIFESISLRSDFFYRLSLGRIAYQRL